jgi:hypothetical protein
MTRVFSIRWTAFPIPASEKGPGRYKRNPAAAKLFGGMGMFVRRMVDVRMAVFDSLAGMRMPVLVNEIAFRQ